MKEDYLEKNWIHFWKVHKNSFSVGFKNHIRHMDTLQQQSPDVQRSNTRWVLKTVERNLPNESCPTSLPLLQPAQCPIKMWEIFTPHPVERSGRGLIWGTIRTFARRDAGKPLKARQLYRSLFPDSNLDLPDKSVVWKWTPTFDKCLYY
jgi:hypothetical protein